MEKRSFKNRRLIVESQFQIKYSLILASIGFTLCAIVGIGLIVLLKHNYDFLVDEGVLQTPAVLAHVSNEESKLFWIYFTLSVIVVGLFFYAGLFVTNRFIGPVKGLSRELSKLKEGNLTAHLNLRNNDEMQAVAHLFNESMQNLREETQMDVDSVTHWIDGLDNGVNKTELKAEMDRWVKSKKERTLR